MRTRALATLLALAALALPTLAAGAGPAEATHAVDIVDFDYDPNPVVVRMGDTVVWTNLDLAHHTVTSWDLTWTSDYLRQGESYARTFDLPGVWFYRCLPHANMQAAVVVLPPEV